MDSIHVSIRACVKLMWYSYFLFSVLFSTQDVCGWLSQPLSTMPDKTPQWHIAVLQRPTCILNNSYQEHNGASRVLQRISSCMPRPVDSGGPSHPRRLRMLLCCLRRPLKPSASAGCSLEAVPALQGTRFPLRPTGCSAYA